MAMRAVKCIHCESEEVVKMGYQKMGRQDANAKTVKRHFKQNM